MRLQELKTKSAVRMDEGAESRVRFFLQSSFYNLGGTWQWEMAAEALFCSDVLFSFPHDFAGTKAIFHPDDAAVVKEAVSAGEKISSLQFRIITTYGEVKTVAGENITVTEDVQAVVAWQEEMVQALFREQERKAAFSHLQVLKDLTERTGRFNHTGFWYFNTATNETWYSDYVFRLHSLPPQSLNAHLHTFHPFIHPEDREVVAEFMDKSYMDKTPLHMDYRIAVNDIERWISYKSAWFFSEKGEEIIGGIYQDITEQKKLERELEVYKNTVQFQQQQLLYDEQQAAIGHWQLTLLTRKTTYSDQCYRIFGVNPGTGTPIITTFINHVHPDDQERVETYYRKILQEHNVPDIEYRIIRADGKTRHLVQKGKLLMYEGEMVVSGIIQDVTVQRMLEKKVATLQERLLQSTWRQQQGDEVSNTAGWIMDLEEGTIEWSESFYNLAGFQKNLPQNITEKNLFSIIHPHDAKDFREHWEEAVQQHLAATFDFRLMLRGSVYYMRAHFSHQTLGEKTYFIGTIRDNTGEQVLQQQLSQRVQLAESLTENIPDRLIITDSNNTILLWNKACEEAYKVKKVDAIGQNFFDIFPHLKTEEEIQLFNRVHRGEKVVVEGAESALGNGYYNACLMPLYTEGEVTGVLHVINDVTKETELRQRLDERLQLIESIVQSSVDRIIALDRNMNYLYWNKKAEEYYRLPKEEVLGKNILEVFPHMVADPSYNEIRKTLRGETVYLPVDVEKGNYFETYLIPIKTAKGEVTSVLWIAHDLTVDVELQQEQRKGAQALSAIDAAIIELDNDYRLKYINPVSERFFGRQKEELLGNIIWNLYPEAVNAPGYKAIVKAATERESAAVEYYSLIYKRWIYMNAVPVEGGVLLFQYDRQDIREAQQKLQETTRLLLAAEEVGKVGSYELALPAMDLQFSDGMFRLFGEEPQSFKPTLEWIDQRSHPDDRAVIQAMLEKSLAEKQPYKYTRRIFRKDGEMRVVEVHGNVACDATGNVVKFLGLAQDITERKRTEDALVESKLFIEQVMDATPDFIMVFSFITNKNEYVNRSRYKGDDERYQETL